MIIYRDIGMCWFCERLNRLPCKWKTQNWTLPLTRCKWQQFVWSSAKSKPKNRFGSAAPVLNSSSNVISGPAFIRNIPVHMIYYSRIASFAKQTLCWRRLFVRILLLAAWKLCVNFAGNHRVLVGCNLLQARISVSFPQFCGATQTWNMEQAGREEFVLIKARAPK